MIPPRRAVERTRSTRSGGLPMVNAVPPPTGATANPRASASARTPAVACGSSGTTISEAVTPSTVTDSTSDSLERMDAQFLRHGLHAQGSHFAAHVALGEEFLRVEH